jgi:hypothetical protein
VFGAVWIYFMASTVREIRDAPLASWRLKELGAKKAQ